MYAFCALGSVAYGTTQAQAQKSSAQNPADQNPADQKGIVPPSTDAGCAEAPAVEYCMASLLVITGALDLAGCRYRLVERR